MSKSPAFRFYPSDFWGSPDVQAMDLHEVAAYLALLSAAWLSDPPGCLQDDDEKLRRWARMSREQWAESRTTLLLKFPVMEPGTRVNPRLFHEAEKQLAFRASQSEKGKKGGRPKAGGKPGLSQPKPGLSPGLSPEKPSVSVSASAEEQKTAPLIAVTSLTLTSDTKKVKDQPFVLPEWISREEWNGFVEGRRKKHGPPTAYASRLIVQDLQRFRDEGFDPIAILQYSAVSGYARVFRPDGKPSVQTTVQPPLLTTAERAREQQRSSTL